MAQWITLLGVFGRFLAAVIDSFVIPLPGKRSKRKRRRDRSRRPPSPPDGPFGTQRLLSTGQNLTYDSELGFVGCVVGSFVGTAIFFGTSGPQLRATRRAWRTTKTKAC